MKNEEKKFSLPKIDELFTTQSERDVIEGIRNIKISEISDFKNHPYKVLNNDEMLSMVNSILENGVIDPVLIRPKPNGGYEMISGHRRKKACEIAGLTEIPARVRDLTDDEAIILMVDSNCQREYILPSEKAFAYKMKMDALNNQGKRNDLTLSHVDTKLDNASKIGKDFNDSRATVFRYIRLTELIPKLLEMVDNEVFGLSPKIALSIAHYLSYLSKEEQETLLDLIEYIGCTPSLSQAKIFKEWSEQGTLTTEKMEQKMQENKPNQVPSLRVSMNRLNNILPLNLKNNREREEYVIKAVEFYDSYQKRKNEKDKLSR